MPVPNLSNAPGLITIDGVDYMVRQPTNADAAMIRTFAIKESKRLHSPIQVAMEELAKIPPETWALLPVMEQAEVRRVVMKEAVALATHGDSSPEALESVGASTNFAAFMFWLLAKDLQPDLTLVKAKELVRENNFLEVGAAMEAAIGLSDFFATLAARAK